MHFEPKKFYVSKYKRNLMQAFFYSDFIFDFDFDFDFVFDLILILILPPDAGIDNSMQ